MCCTPAALSPLLDIVFRHVEVAAARSFVTALVYRFDRFWYKLTKRSN